MRSPADPAAALGAAARRALAPAGEDWREPIYYDSQVSEWWAGMICSVLASAISYYCVSKYADIMAVLRLQRTNRSDKDACGPGGPPAAQPVPPRATPEATTVPARLGDADPAPAESTPAGTAAIPAGRHPRSGSTGTRATAASLSLARVIRVRTPALLLFALAFATSVALDCIALAILPLTLVVPITMLIFVWGTIYRWRLAENRSRFLLSSVARRAYLIVLLTCVAIAFSPKGLYVVHIPRVVRWDRKSIVYTAMFVAVTVILTGLRRYPKHALRALRFTQMCDRDLITIIRACLAGILGGQALVLLKLVAEIVENALFNHGIEFFESATLVVVCVALLTTGMHIYSFHYMLSVLDEANVRLLVPVHRLTFIISSSIGASLYMEEWVLQETSWLDVALYSLAVIGLLLVCIVFAAEAVQANMRERNQSNLDGLAHGETGAEGSVAHANEVAPDHHAATPAAVAVRGLWDLGAGSHEVEDDGEFFMSSSRTLFGKSVEADDSPCPTTMGSIDLEAGASPPPASQSGALPANPRALMKHLAQRRHQALARSASFTAQDSGGAVPAASATGHRSARSCGTAQDLDELALVDRARTLSSCTSDSEESFMSIMDEEDFLASGGAISPLPDREDAAQVELDEVYPVPDNTMVVPKGMPNPHADPGKSYWSDAGQQPGGWKVRGPTYDQDRVKVPCGQARMKVVAMDWHYAPAQPVRNIVAMPGGFIEQHHAGRSDRPFLFVVNFMVPSVGNYVSYLARDRSLPDPLFDSMLASFIDAPDDEYRNARLKLIPGVLEGSYFVRKAVGSKPALLCQKLTTSYFRGDNCFEVQIDVGSSVVGARIFGAVKGFASSLMLHLGVVIESKTRRELPERLLYGMDIACPVMAPRTAQSPSSAPA